jgi:hypothetical protein
MKSAFDVLLSGVCILVGYTAVFAQHRVQMGLPPARIMLPSAEVTLPMLRLGGRPLVQISINGKGPYPFVLDTGAHISVISQDLAEELKLEQVGIAKMPSSSGGAGAESKLIQIDRLQMGEAQIASLACASVDLSQMFSGPDAPRGVLSAATFRGYLLTLDYPHGLIRIRTGELPVADNATIFDYDPAGLPAISITVAGMKLRVTLDSGSPGSITLPGRYMKELPLAAKPVASGHVKIMNAVINVYTARLRGTVTVGKYVENDPQLGFLESFPMGDLGAKFLANFSVTLDAKNNRVMLVKADDSAKSQ